VPIRGGLDRDSGIEVADIWFTRAEPNLVIEFDLKLVHAWSQRSRYSPVDING